MRIEIPMPKMGESIMEGTILKWHKNPGESIRKDEILFEISTDKVDSEIPSPVDGIVAEILAPEGETLEVGKIVAFIETDTNVAITEQLSSAKEKIVESEKVKVVHAINKNVNREPLHTVDIPMPKMGESVMEGTIIKWHKKIGEAVKHDEILFEISTDKVDTEVPSPVDGTLAEIIVKEQETVEVGTVVAKVSTAQQSNKAEAEDEILIEDEQVHSVIAANVLNQNINDESKKENNRFYSPLVLNIAKKEKVSFDELAKINGSGIGGRVTKNDVLNYVNNRNVSELTSAKVFSPSNFGEDDKYEANKVERIPMDNIRQKIMQHMVKSRDTSVHVSATLEVDMTRIHNFIEANKTQYQNKAGVKLTYMAFISYAAVKALKAFTVVNAAIDGSTILQKRFINLGIAVALEPNGLIVPNVKDAHNKSITELAKAISEVAAKARTKKLTPDDVTNGTFSITNYGVFGTVIGTPIINQPEVAILGVGALTKKPVVIEVDGTDMIAIRHMMTLALSHDHRLVDGMVGGKFLSSIKKTLEQFDEKEML